MLSSAWLIHKLWPAIVGLLTQGIYRVNGNVSDVELLKEMYKRNTNLDINSIGVGINAVATALKGFIRELSEPLIPEHLYDDLITASSK